jgi:microcystin-dependent protein
MGATGGDEKVTLGVSHIPAHTHSAITAGAGNHNHEVVGYRANFDHGGSATESCLDDDGDGLMNPLPKTKDAGDHTHAVNIGDTGGGKAHENMPPFYVLAFIMRMS